MVLNRVLDTNAVFIFWANRLAETLPDGDYFVSVITEMELLSYPTLDSAAESQIRSFLSEVTVVGLTRPVIDLAIRLRREQALKLPDAVIAATALALEAELWTNDDKLLRISALKCRHLNLKI